MPEQHYLAEYQAACERAALFSCMPRSRIRVSGPEAAFFLHNLCTNDIKNLAEGAGCEIFLCNARARVLAHGWVYRWPGGDPTFWMDVEGGPEMAVFQHLNRHWISEQIDLQNRSAATVQAYLAGPAAAAMLQTVLGGAVAGMAPLNTSHWRLDGVGTVQVFRNDRFGLPGFDLVWLQDGAEAMGRLLMEQGPVLAGPVATEILSVEAGLPRFGFEMDENRAVFEVGRAKQAISYTKGCYLGQEPIVMARDRGHVNRTLLGLTFADGGAAPRGAKVWHNGQEVGQVTSSVVSPRLGRAVALAYLKRGSQEPGLAVEVDADGQRRPAQVAALPLLTSGQGTAVPAAGSGT
jgi:folate-binding protein YgfZ